MERNISTPLVDGLLQCCESYIQHLCPFKMDLEAKEGLERYHYVAKMGIVSSLVHEAEPIATEGEAGVGKSRIALRYLHAGSMTL